MTIQKVCLEEDWDIVYLVGEMALTYFDERTEDFVLTMQRAGLKVVDRPQSMLDRDHFDKNWSWLVNFAILSVSIADKKITPVWKPNRYGEPADFNAFQKITYTPTEIIIEVAARGTSEDVFERYNPYEDYRTGEKVFLSLHSAIENSAESETAKGEKLLNSVHSIEELADKLFE